MKCPKCGGEPRVTDTVNVSHNEIFRRRRCRSCGNAFFTAEFEVIANKRFKKEWNHFVHKSADHN